MIAPLRRLRAAYRLARARLPPEEGALPESAAWVPLPFAPEHAIAVHRHDAFISPWIAAGHLWEPEETAVVRRLAPHAMWFLDIGANLGWFSCLAKLTLPAGSLVAAVEPDPENLLLLGHTLSRQPFRSILRLGVAASDRSGTALLHRSRANRGDHRLDDPPEDVVDSVSVRTETLDALFDGALAGPGVLKLDVQGHEPEALAGARRLLASNRLDPALIVEVWPPVLTRRLGDWTALFASLRRFPWAMPIDAEVERGRLTFLPLQEAVAAIAQRWREAPDPATWYISMLVCSDGWRSRLS